MWETLAYVGPIAGAAMILAFMFWPSQYEVQPSKDCLRTRVKETYRQFTWDNIKWLGRVIRSIASADARKKEDESWRREVQRNRLARVQSLLLRLLVAGALILLVAGFGYDLVMLCVRGIGNGVGEYIAKSGGIGVAILALAGSIFTAIKASPWGGGDARAGTKPGVATKIIFAVTPPAVLLLLLLLASWASVWLLQQVMQGTGEQVDIRLRALTAGVFIGVIICVFLAVYEMNWLESASYRRRAVVAGMLFAAVSWTIYALWKHREHYSWSDSMVLIPCALGVAVLWVMCGKCDLLGRKPESRRKCWLGFVVTLTAGLAVGAAAYWLSSFCHEHCGRIAHRERRKMLYDFAACGTLLCGLLGVLAWRWEPIKGLRSRPVGLLGCAGAILLCFLLLPLTANLNTERTALTHATLCGVALSLAWVVAWGWTADPNALSLHTFYRARLVRAYLGASNPNRRVSTKDITETVHGDDVLLKDLDNCARGGPYHLVNTTLNLVGGRDLTTSQRLAANFIMSQEFCGSSRTGYRKSQDYMSGRMSLGSAVAISGAAASANMGSQTYSAAMVMLMTLFNVRLGYWTATPRRERWKESAIRLWPYYMMLEGLSSTTEDSMYCSLSDGGHFDNTAIYALIERGCSYIMACDCGADPVPCFADIGDMIRRCRIDFGAEIELNVQPFLRPEGKYAQQHVVVGMITYDDRHLESLGLPKHRKTGKIIWFKPSITARDETADVRQYAIENAEFPQQTTADQWFDEAQFESYRRLAVSSLKCTLGTLKSAKGRTEDLTSGEDIEAFFTEAAAEFGAKSCPWPTRLAGSA